MVNFLDLLHSFSHTKWIPIHWHLHCLAMNINNTDHFLLAATRDEPKRGATNLKLASLTVAVISIIALSGLLI
jgi:hypothetical protein